MKRNGLTGDSRMKFVSEQLTYRIPLVLMEDLAVTPVHVGHVNGVCISPIDFPA